MTDSSMSATSSIHPSPRTKYSARLISITRAPTSRFEPRTARKTSSSLTPCARMASGSTSIWYSRTKPPTEATSATPSADISA